MLVSYSRLHNAHNLNSIQYFVYFRLCLNSRLVTEHLKPSAMNGLNFLTGLLFHIQTSLPQGSLNGSGASISFNFHEPYIVLLSNQ